MNDCQNLADALREELLAASRGCTAVQHIVYSDLIRAAVELANRIRQFEAALAATE